MRLFVHIGESEVRLTIKLYLNIYAYLYRLKVDHNVYIQTLFLGHPGGATPGKFLLGLRIYSCDQVKFPIAVFQINDLPHLCAEKIQ